MDEKHVILRVLQRDGSWLYELYREPIPRPTGSRVVYFVASGDLEWALSTAESLNIPSEDVRIGFDGLGETTYTG